MGKKIPHFEKLPLRAGGLQGASHRTELAGFGFGWLRLAVAWLRLALAWLGFGLLFLGFRLDFGLLSAGFRLGFGWLRLDLAWIRVDSASGFHSLGFGLDLI